MAIPIDLGSVNVGNVKKFTASFTDSENANVPEDPATVAFGFEPPTGIITRFVYGIDIQVVKSATGVYYAKQLIDVEGIWYVRIYSTGTGQAAIDAFITAVGSPIGNV